MEKHGYLISHNGYHTCSECGTKYSNDEYWKYYCLDKIIRWHINCKFCGAIFSEQPKRCYYEEHEGNESNACTEQVEIDGVTYCTQQLKARREELRSWGAYYKCPYYKPPEDDYLQLSFF